MQSSARGPHGMPELQRRPTSGSIVDVLDHILDKGIVIDAWVQISVVGIDLSTEDARVVVASIDTYADSGGSVAQVFPTFRAPHPIS
jgi:gas vesicle structural protein